MFGDLSHQPHQEYLKVDDTLTSRLLGKGNYIAIEKGRIVIKPVSGKPIPEEWLNDNREKLIVGILQATKIDAYTYESHTTGNYGKPRASGITLQFINPFTGENPYAVFNAELKRDRNTKHGKKGDALPNGHFRVGKKSRFYSFWRTAELTMPKRLSSFHDYMGKLKALLFVADIDHKNRMKKSSIRLLSITYQQLQEAFNVEPLAHNIQTLPGQSPDNCQTVMPDKNIQQPHINHSLRPIQTTGQTNYGLSKQGSADTRANNNSINSTQLQHHRSNDEWLADYDGAES